VSFWCSDVQGERFFACRPPVFKSGRLLHLPAVVCLLQGDRTADISERDVLYVQKYRVIQEERSIFWV
jgi:hypothetical protein